LVEIGINLQFNSKIIYSDRQQLWDVEYNTNGFSIFMVTYDRSGHLHSMFGRFEVNPKDNQELIKIIGINEHVQPERVFILYNTAGFSEITGAVTMQTGFFYAIR